jgi:hypothetical protein
MTSEHDLHVTESATRQGRQQMLNRGHLARAQIQGGAQLAVTHLIRPKLDRLLHSGQAHLEPRLIRWPKLHRGLSPTVEADA